MRYRFLDILRGINFISMFFYHLCWDLVYLYGKSWEWYQRWPGYMWQQSICWGFILISGFCWPLGRKKWKRGLIVFGAGVLVMAVTAVITPQQRVIFGILTFLGSCMLLLQPFERQMEKMPAFWGMGGSFLLFLLLRDVNQGFLGFEGVKIVGLPKELYGNTATAFLGFPGEEFWSTDYFSLIPWLFLFLTGYYLGRVVREKQGMPNKREPKNNPLEWIGRHSLLLYLIHQPIIYFLLHCFMGAF